MKRNLFNVGIGGFGVRLSNEVSRKLVETGVSVTTFAVDTDFDEINEVSCDYKLDLSVPDSLGNAILRLKEENVRIFSDDLDCLGYVKTLPMDKGANSWRIKAMVSFIAYMSDKENKKNFDEFLDSFSFSIEDSYVFNVFTSLAGGTGSALFVALSLYIKKFLKEKGCAKVEFNLYGACPDIFTEGLNGELKVKAYANAYASLDELNKVNNVALRKCEENIKIGYENSSIGVLFDSENAEFYNKERMPFNKVYLFDRIPGVFSTDLHLNILADYVYYINTGFTTENTSKNCALVKAYTAGQIELNTEDIIDYIAKYSVKSNIKKEIFKPFNDIEKTESSNLIGVSKKQVTDENEQFALKVLSYLENLDAGKDEKTSCILGRLEENDLALTIDDESWLSSYIEKISSGIEEKLQTPEYLNVYSLLTVKESEKKGKKERLEELKEKAEKIVKNLNTYYFSTEEKIKSEDVASLFMGEDKELSLITNILTEDGKFIHPTLALIRLSILYIQAKKRVKIYTKLSEKEMENAKESMLIPEKLLLLDNPSLEAKGYAKLPADRFLRVIAKREKIVDTKKLSKKELKAYLKDKKRYVLSSADDEKFICLDAKDVLTNIATERKGYYFNQLALLLSNLIDGYKDAINGLNVIKYQTETAVEDAKKERLTQSLYYGVSTDKKSREKAIKEYFDEVKPLGHFDSDNDLGKRFFDYALSFNSEEKTLSIKPFTNLVNNFILDTKERIKKSEYYERLEGKNVLTDIIESAEKSYLKTALMIKPLLITLNPTEEIERKTLFISKNVAEYVLSLKEKLMLRATTPEEAVDELLVNMGEYETEIKVLEGLSDKKAFAVAERGGIKISSLAKFNGEKDISIYKNEYEKAINNMQKYETPMWNPHVFDIKSTIDLQSK